MAEGLSPLQRRLIEAAADIREGEPDDIAYQHSILCQTSLPAAKPPEGMLRWEKRQGRATLLVQAGEALYQLRLINAGWSAGATSGSRCAA